MVTEVISLEQQIEKKAFMEGTGRIVFLKDVLGLLPNYNIHPKGERVCIQREQLELLFRREDRLWKESKRQNKSRFLKFLEEILGEEGIKRALLGDEK